MILKVYDESKRNLFMSSIMLVEKKCTAQKMKFSIKDFFSKYDHIVHIY